jgi:hypothetical protein
LLQKKYFTFLIALLIGLSHQVNGQNQALLEKEAATSYSKKDFKYRKPVVVPPF